MKFSIRRLFISLVGTCVFLLAISLRAQQSPASTTHSKACSIDNSPPSEADRALFLDDFKKTEVLSRAALKKDSADRLAHLSLVRALIGTDKVDEAQKEVDAWTSSAAQEPYAIVAAGELRHAEGYWLESYALMLKALKLDPCLPTAYAGLAAYESASGYRLTARKHLTLAHQLDPANREYELDWIFTLPLSEQILNLQSFLDRQNDLTDKQSRALHLKLGSLKAESGHACELAASDGPAHIPMVPMYAPYRVGVAAYGIEIAFNGKKRVLQIDTGASGFVLTRTGATALGLSPIEKSLVDGFGSGGGTSTLLQQANSVHIGGLEFKDCVVQSLAVNGVLGGGNQIGERLDDTDGIVGSDIFSRYLVTLDYIRHEIRLDPLPQQAASSSGPIDALGGRTDPDWMQIDRVVPPSMDSWTKVYRNGHELIMPARLSRAGEGGSQQLFIIDTGAESNLIDTAVAKQITHANESDNGLMGLGGGIVRLSETGKFVLDFAGLRLPVSSMDAINLPPHGGISGFLGYPTLSQLVMQIDYRDDLVHLTDPNGQHK
jgi:predicted aspartyl protease